MACLEFNRVIPIQFARRLGNIVCMYVQYVLYVLSMCV